MTSRTKIIKLSQKPLRPAPQSQPKAAADEAKKQKENELKDRRNAS